MFADLRRDCATELLELNAPGYAVGGLSVGEPRSFSLEMTEVTDAFAAARPAALCHGRRHAGGATRIRCAWRGHDGLRAPFAQCPQWLPVYFQGRVMIKQARYRDDPAPLDSQLPVLYLPYLLAGLLASSVSGGRNAVSTLATIHNLKYYLDMMRQIRQAILLGTFRAYLDRAPQSGGRIELDRSSAVLLNSFPNDELLV